MPEGDTIAYAANRIRPVLEGRVPESIAHAAAAARPRPLARAPRRPPGERGRHARQAPVPALRGRPGAALAPGDDRRVGRVPRGRRWRRSPRRAWLVMRSQGHDVVEFDGPTLELMTEGRARFDQRLAALGPDVLRRTVRRSAVPAGIRTDDQTRATGDALLDQRNVAGIGNMWKAEGVLGGGGRPVAAAVGGQRRGAGGDRREGPPADGRCRPARGRWRSSRACTGCVGRPCPRCGERILSRGQGDANRTTYWCPGCQK